VRSTRLLCSLCSAIVIFLPVIALGQLAGPKPTPAPTHENERQMQQSAPAPIQGVPRENTVTVRRSAFARAYFLIYSASTSTGDFVQKGIEDARRYKNRSGDPGMMEVNRETPPGVLLVCFEDVVGDSAFHESGGGGVCVAWNTLSVELAPALDGMTILL